MNRLKRFICVAALVIACCVTLVLPAFAAETAPSVEVPVTVSLSGSKPKPAEEYTIRLKAIDGAPLPADAENDEFTVQIKGPGKLPLGPISFDRVGVYEYTISQDKGKNVRCKYDKTVYNMTVYVTNAEDYSGLEANYVVYTEGQVDKVENVTFRNAYPAPSASPRTGDESQPLLYAGLTTLGVVVLAGLFLTRKPKSNEEE